MNKNAFDVFLQTQRSNQEINEIAALGKLAGKIGQSKLVQSGIKRGTAAIAGKLGGAAAASKSPTGTPAFPRAGTPGASATGITRALQARRARTQTPEFKDKLAAAGAAAAKAGPGSKAAQSLKGNIDKVKSAVQNPANMKSSEGKLRQSRVALAQKLRDRGGDASVGMKMKAGLGAVGRGIGRGIKSLDTPQNREMAGKAVKGVAAFAKKGGFSSGFNKLYKDDITTGYKSAGGAIAPGRLIGVGTQSGDEDQMAQTDDPFKGLSPTERRRAMQRGAAQ